MNPYLLEGKYSIKDLVDLDYLRTILEKFSAATGFTTGLVSFPDQELLVATGWRDICTKFHRVNSESAKHCLDSNVHLTSALRERKQLNIRSCRNGLVDGATPVIIKGKHLASLATGQVLLSEPDMDQFIRRAKKYGFDQEAYLEAVRQVPVVSQEKLTSALSFLSEMAVMMAELGLANLLMKETAQALEEEVKDRRRAEESLRGSKQRYRILFDSIADYIYTHDLQGRITSVNPSISQMLDYHPEELIGKPVAELMPPKLRREFYDQYLVDIRRQGSYDGVSVYRSRSGRDRMVEYRSVLVTPPGQEPYVIGSGRDVTERINAAREMKKLEAQLRQAQKMEAVGTLAGGVAHDFNNMLQIIGGYLQMIKTGPGPDNSVEDDISKAQEAVMRASELVRRILTFSRKVEPQPVPLNLGQAAETALKILERTFPRMIKIETDLAADLALINADPNQVEQMLLNLGVNAQDAMPEGGTLSIKTSNRMLGDAFCRQNLQTTPGGYVQLTMTDTGIGMEKHTLEHLFDPFFTTKQVGKGTGLGLSTVYGMVRNHQGHITVKSSPGQGAAFTILFPAVAEDTVPQRAQSDAQPELSGGSEHVLLVDDEAAILEVGRHFLKKHGYRVSLAASGEEALAAFGPDGPFPDLVVMDMSMPGMGGVKALAAIKGIAPHTKVLISSGYSTTSQTKAVADQSAQGFIAKPYRINELLQTIRSVLDLDA